MNLNKIFLPAFICVLTANQCLMCDEDHRSFNSNENSEDGQILNGDLFEHDEVNWDEIQQNFMLSVLNLLDNNNYFAALNTALDLLQRFCEENNDLMAFEMLVREINQIFADRLTGEEEYLQIFLRNHILSLRGGLLRGLIEEAATGELDILSEYVIGVVVRIALFEFEFNGLIRFKLIEEYILHLFVLANDALVANLFEVFLQHVFLLFNVNVRNSQPDTDAFLQRFVVFLNTVLEELNDLLLNAERDGIDQEEQAVLLNRLTNIREHFLSYLRLILALNGLECLEIAEEEWADGATNLTLRQQQFDLVNHAQIRESGDTDDLEEPLHNNNISSNYYSYVQACGLDDNETMTYTDNDDSGDGGGDDDSRLRALAAAAGQEYMERLQQTSQDEQSWSHFI